MGSAAYVRSGHLAVSTNRRTAKTLAATALVGTPLGVAANNAVSARAFSVVGIGGPMLTVPLLVAWGTAPLSALAASQVQSVVIAGVGAVGYLAAAGSVDWLLALVVGIPEIAGALLGWRVARALPTRTLSYTLVVALLVVAPYLALHG